MSNVPRSVFNGVGLATILLHSYTITHLMMQDAPSEVGIISLILLLIFTALALIKENEDWSSYGKED